MGELQSIQIVPYCNEFAPKERDKLKSPLKKGAVKIYHLNERNLHVLEEIDVADDLEWPILKILSDVLL